MIDKPTAFLQLVFLFVMCSRLAGREAIPKVRGDGEREYAESAVILCSGGIADKCMSGIV